MRKAERAMVARRALDDRLRRADLSLLRDQPTRGWIRAIRDALGMTSRQLASRLGVSQVAVTKLERSEVDGSARLESLRRAAAALDCDLVYALMPRSTLDDTVRQRASLLAGQDLQKVDRTMRLEDQALTDEQLTARLADYADRLVTAGRLWDDQQLP
jgi:predicted DNA-binding mobile mystery protein A